MLPRRAFLYFTGGAALASGDFWKDKKASEWSEKDVQRLLTHSPWAKEVGVDLHIAGTEMSGRSSGRGRGGGGGGGRTSPGGGGGADSMEGGGGFGGGGAGGGGGDAGGGSMGSRPEPRALVLWESARPVREAAHKELPKELAGNYLISVTGLQLGGGRGMAREDREEGSPEERLKAATKLERKGSDPIYPTKVQVRQTQRGPSILFLFAGGSQPIQATDKEVLFHINMGRVELKAKFALKDMIYDGALAL